MGAARPRPIAWVVATAVGLMAGLGLGAALVDYQTDIGSLALQGAVCGAFVGAAQAVVLLPRLGPVAIAWPVALSGIWALGWAITTAAGIQVEDQFTVFGSAGAIVATLLTAVLPILLNRHPHREERIMTRHIVFGTGQVGHPVVDAARRPGARRRRRQPGRPGQPSRRDGRRRGRQ